MQDSLRALYGDVGAVEAFVGAIVEDHQSSLSVGESLRASLVDQFVRLRDGDRFFYTGDSSLQSTLVTDIIETWLPSARSTPWLSSTWLAAIPLAD